MRRALLALGLLGPAAGAWAGDITLLVCRSTPDEVWAAGFGAALSSTRFRVLSLEGEAARQPGEAREDIMTTFTGSAFLAPTIGRVIPYGGVGLGYFRQTHGASVDKGLVRIVAVGAKLRLGVLMLKGEYRKMSLPDEAPLPIDDRVSAGVGVVF